MPEKREEGRAVKLPAAKASGRVASLCPEVAVMERCLFENGIAIDRLSRQFVMKNGNKLHFP